MAVTYSWKINSIATHPEPVDGSEGVIVQISASRIATDGTNTVQDARVITWTPADLSSPFILLADVTEADVIGWVELFEADNNPDADGLTSLDRTDADLARQLANAVAAPESAPLPWAVTEAVAA